MNKDTYTIFSQSKEFVLWPMKKQKFLDILYGENDSNIETQVFIEKLEDSVIGYISVKCTKELNNRKGSIVLLFVDEKYRGKGIGKKLLTKGVSWLKEKEVNIIKCGSGAGSYFWPGVPDNFNVVEFFTETGFDVTATCVADMYRDITDFKTTAGAYSPLAKFGISIEYANDTYAEAISAFVKSNFPNWGEYYLEEQLKTRPLDFFFAHINDEVIAVSTLWKGNSNWDLLFENSVGGGGALGIAEKWRGKGIGLAMKCWGTEKIKLEGIKYVYIGWTDAIGFYEKLGFKIWRTFKETLLHV